MNSQVIEMLNALPKKELKAIDEYIKHQKREKLKRLHKFLVKHINQTNQPDFKEKLFQFVFEKQHTSKTDYLLRNELRLLGQAIKNILVKEEINQSSYKDLVFLQALKRLKIESIFTKEIERFHKEKSETGDYASLSELNASFLEDVILRSKYTIKDKEQLKEHIIESIESEKKAFVYKIRSIEVLLAYTERVLASLKDVKEFTPSETSVSLNDDAINEANSKAKYWTAESYRAYNEEAIVALENSIECLEGSSNRNKDTNIKISIVKARIGLEYLLIGKYESSIKYFEASLEYKDDLPSDRLVSICINYISVLCRLEQFEKALKVYNDYPEVLAINVMSERVLVQYLTLLILCNQIESAAKAFPKNLKEGEMDTYQAFRLLLCIIYIEQGDEDLALNEIDNLLRHVRTSSKGLVDAYKEIIDLVRHYIEIQVETRSIQKEKRKKALTKLNQQLIAFKSKHDKFQSESLFLKWLEKKIAD